MLEATGISRSLVQLSAEAHEATKWDDRQLEAEVLRTKRAGLLTQQNIKISQLNKFEIEKAKYGGIGVPPRLDTAIEDLNSEVEKLEARLKDVGLQLAALTASR
jgi:hypothetical protein